MLRLLLEGKLITEDLVDPVDPVDTTPAQQTGNSGPHAIGNAKPSREITSTSPQETTSNSALSSDDIESVRTCYCKGSRQEHEAAVKFLKVYQDHITPVQALAITGSITALVKAQTESTERDKTPVFFCGSLR